MEGREIRMDLGLRGKTAVVTGASRGVGKEIARTLGREGANVVLTYQGNREQAEAVVKEIEGYGQKSMAIQLDLSNEEAVAELVEKASERIEESIDILVNNAAVWPTNYIKDMSLQEWQKTIGINLDSVFLTSQGFIKHCLFHKKSGRILNITSQAAFYGSTTGHSHYAASKSGMIAFAISLAREHAKDDITVNNLALGIVETDMIKDSLQQKGDYYVNRIPVGRVAKPEEMADIAAFLVSEKSKYMTGATVDATGGMLMR